MLKEFDNKYNMHKDERVMKSLCIEQGIILPRIFSDTGPMWGLGGVCDRDNNFLELSEYHGGWAEHGGFYDWSEEEYRDDTVVYLGVFFKHWGHFLVDLVGRMWYLVQNNGKQENLKIAYLGEEEPSGNYLEFFELLGIKSQQILHITRPTRFRNVIVPEFACRPCIWYTSEFQSIFKYMASKVESEDFQLKDFDDIHKVYFSRRGFLKAQKSEFGEYLIEQWLKTNGYTIISPEKLSLREQIYIWNHAEEIVCLNGTIPVNVAFSQNKNLRLIVMNKTKLVHKNLDLFLLMSGCKTIFLDVYHEPFKKYPKSIGEGPFLLYFSNDLIEYSRLKGMVIPYSRFQICMNFVGNYFRLSWCIIDVRGRLRKCVSQWIPDSVKRKIRNRELV